MPIVQTNYPLRQDAGLVGQPAMSRYGSDTAVVETAAGIGFGQPIQRGIIGTQLQAGGTLFQGALLLATGTFIGISRRDQGRAAVDGDKVPRGAPMAYFTSGHVYVLADAAVTQDTVVRWNSATGRYTNAAASGTVFECTGWTFDTAASAAGQLVIIKR